MIVFLPRAVLKIRSIRDYIAFPKNNSGRDVMLDAPSSIDDKQFEELHIKLNLK